MYHEERVIDGVLCWRGTPDGEWTEYTAKELTAMVQGLRQTVFKIEAALEG
jgi:hypothetical protein